MRTSRSAGSNGTGLGLGWKRARNAASHKSTDIFREGVRRSVARRREDRGGRGTASLWIDDARSPARAVGAGGGFYPPTEVSRHRDGAHGIFTTATVPPDAAHILEDPAKAQRFLERRRQERRRAVAELVPKKWKMLELLSVRLYVCLFACCCGQGSLSLRLGLLRAGTGHRGLPQLIAPLTQRRHDSQQVRALGPDDLALIRQRRARARQKQSGERRRKGHKKQGKRSRDPARARREAEESAAIDGLPRIPVRATAESLFLGCYQAEPRFLTTVPHLCAAVRDHLCLEPVRLFQSAKPTREACVRERKYMQS